MAKVLKNAAAHGEVASKRFCVQVSDSAKNVSTGQKKQSQSFVQMLIVNHFKMQYQSSAASHSLKTVCKTKYKTCDIKNSQHLIQAQYNK